MYNRIKLKHLLQQFHHALFTTVITVCLTAATSCNEPDYAPKPHGYFRIELPEHKYKVFNPEQCPFSFEVPAHSVVIRDTNSLAEPCWYYVMMPELNAQIYLTYKSLDNNFEKYVEDSRTLVYKHTTRASSIDEQVVHLGNGVSGIIYSIGGDAASAVQFYVSDSTKHFLRGALYFNSSPNADSLAPVITYLNRDIGHLLQTLHWK